MAVEIVGTGQPDGTSLGKATTEKIGAYGNAVVQATVATAGTDLATVIVEMASLRLAIKNFGIIA